MPVGALESVRSASTRLVCVTAEMSPYTRPLKRRCIHQSREKLKIRHERVGAVAIEVTPIPERRAMGDDDPHARVERPAESQWIAERLVVTAHCTFVAGVGNERQASATSFA